MFDNFIRFLRGGLPPEVEAPAAPTETLVAQPITLNLAAGSKAQAQRHAGRLMRLYRWQEAGRDTTPEMLAEIRSRQGGCMLAGYDAPSNSVEAQALLDALKG